MISIIVPVFNEEDILKKNFVHLEKLAKNIEMIFVDGGSSDATVELASRLGRVVQSEKGRALQMNRGAREAKGEIFLFLYADSLVDEDAIFSLRECINKGSIGGCFTQRLDDERVIYRFIEAIGNRRARNKKIFYGDQGIFVKKDTFFSVGGFPEVMVMEDILFSQRLRGSGKLEVMDNIIAVSTRRWKKGGFFKTNFLYIAMFLLFYLGLPTSLIAKIYKDVR